MAPDSLYWEAPEIALNPDLFADLIGRLDLRPSFRRAEIYAQSRANQAQIHNWLMAPDDLHPAKVALWEGLLGIKLVGGGLASIAKSPSYAGRPAVEIHSARIARRTGPDGQEARELIIEVTQRRYAFNDPKKQETADRDAKYAQKNRNFIFRGGATLVIDLTDNSVRYAVRKRIDDEARLDRQRRWLNGEQAAGLLATYFSTQTMAEPFAFAHRQ
jgi:hypothetical protein